MLAVNGLINSHAPTKTAKFLNFFKGNIRKILQESPPQKKFL